MEVFRTFRNIKCLLRAAALAVVLANLQGAWAMGTTYTWTGGGSDNNWTTEDNWGGTGYPGKKINNPSNPDSYKEDTAVINMDCTIKLDQNIEFQDLYIASLAEAQVIINTNDKSLTTTGYLYTGCTSGSGTSSTTFNSNLTINGTGTVIVGTFDFPHYKTHTITINSGATFKITGNYYGDSDHGELIFQGSGTLFVPASGANVNYGECKISYDILNLTIKPYGNPTYYSVTLNNISKVETNEASVSITKKGDGSATVEYPYTVTDVIKNGSGAGFAFNGTSAISAGSSGYLSITNSTLKDFPITKSGTLNTGDGFTIQIRTPDNARVLSTVSWYKGKTSWTGNESSEWEKTGNWILSDSEKSLYENLETTDITINAVPNKPVISSGDWTIKSIEITANANLTMKGGSLTTNSIKLSDDTSKFSGDKGTVIFIENTDTSTQPSVIFGSNVPKSNATFYDVYIKSGLFNYNIDISNDLYVKGSINLSGNIVFPKNVYIATQASGSLSCNITAKNIVLYSGNFSLTGDLTTKNDLIILGNRYKDSTLQYNHFSARPSGWTTPTILLSDLGKFPNESTPVSEADYNTNLTINGTISAGTSGQGNFYINGATLTGSAGGNNLIIPRNDSPANFCAEGINSTISNIKVVCKSDSTTDAAHLEDGTYAQIPLQDCTTSNCTNFDETEVKIVEAQTVSDNRIHVKFSEPLRNNNSELSDSSLLKQINIGTSQLSYGYITAAFDAKIGETAPAANPTEVYLVSSTTWNTDASSTTVGSGKYTDSKGNFKRVKPAFFIPQYASDSDGNLICGYVITNKWGKRLRDYTISPTDSRDRTFQEITDGIPEIEKFLRVPPAFASVLSVVGGNRLSITFTKPIVTDSSKISYYYQDKITKVVTRETISQKMQQIFPRCFELFSIDDSGNPLASDLQIEKNVSAQIDEFSSGYTIITLQLNRNVTLSDMQNLYIRLVHPKNDDGTDLYPPTIYDHFTQQEGYTVSFIQESDEAHTEDGKNYMILKTAHTLSDFAVGAVSPSYAYISNLDTAEDADKDFFKSVYGTGSAAVHDFSKAQKNYGTLPYGHEISIVTKINTGSESKSELDYPSSLKLFITDSPDSDALFPVINNRFQKSLNAWLPETKKVTTKDFQNYTYTLNTHYWPLESQLINKSPANGFSFILPKENVLQMKAGSQINFLYLLCDADGNYLPHYFSPVCDYENNTYDLSKSGKTPFFAFSLSNSSDLLSLSPWYITLKSITEQRGGVTILNNVINAAVGEKTVLKVNMPSSGNLDIMIMTIDGNIVKYLAHGNASAGEHFYYWDGRNNAGSEVARGIYFVIVKAPGIDENRKVMVVK